MFRKAAMVVLTLVALAGTATLPILARDGGGRGGGGHDGGGRGGVGEFIIEPGQSRDRADRILRNESRSGKGFASERLGSNRPHRRRLQYFSNDNDWGFRQCYRLKRYHTKTGWRTRRTNVCR